MSAPSSYSCFHLFLLVVLALFRLCSSNQNSHHVLCNDVERQALLQFKHGLTDESQRLTSWVAENKDCCTWAGIACDNSTGHVYGIHLPGLDGHCSIDDYYLTIGEKEALKQKLKGEISRSLLDLKQLKHLDLSCNDFGGIQVPKFIGSFQHLRYLNLSRSNFGGSIPPQLGNLSELHVLSLGSFHYEPFETTGMANMKWLSSLGMLHHLDMSGVDLSQATDWLQVINTLPSLLQLHLSRCELSNLHIFRNLTSLELLHVAWNDFMNSSSIFQELSGVVTEAHFIKLVSLKYLKGSANKLILRLQVANWIPPFQLGTLFLRNWVLGPQFPLWLQSQKDLEKLDISNTCISSPMPESFFRSFSMLRYLNMSNNHIQGPLTFSGIPATLEFIDISSNGFWGSLHPFLCSSGVTSMIVLNLGNNNLSGDIPECWDKWSWLEFLNLENNSLSGEIPRTLGSLRNLHHLNMHGNKISGRLHSSLMNLTELDVLQLGRNELNGSIPTWIGTKLTLLRILNLRSNRFDGNIPHELCHSIHIQILDLAHNNLSGNIPRCFNNFSILSGIESKSGDDFAYIGTLAEVSIASDTLVMKGREDTYSSILPLMMLIDLSSNNLTGYIPSELMSLLELTSLNLSRNQLNGSIPEKIGNMKELISLDLSVNKLSGELPMSLSSLHFLSSFNVSFNNLIGRIPIGTQLQSFGVSSFFGNKLCGAPLTEANGCEPVEATAHTIGEKKEDDGADWGLIISIMVGFVSGFWMIMGPLIVRRSWRIAYFGFLSKLRYMVYDVIHKYCCHMFSC
ncbi:putative leucine-rich repeat-containing, plant-type, leucine-rich repeat domain superfamily [Helianthus annuus]|nr:putative leucine-rich repeat-containing, plant-type, leucine-rich repeat domain superfamily [Helianthus annuus]